MGITIPERYRAHIGLPTSNLQSTSHPGGGGGTDPKIAHGGSARGKILDPTGSVCRKNKGQKDLDITEIRGQKDLSNIHLVKNIFLGALPKLGVNKICAEY